jgi:hypothetical protein
MYLHDNSAATVIELVSDYEMLAQTTMSLLPSGTILPSHIKYAVTGRNKDVKKNENLNIVGAAFALGSLDDPLPADIPPADLLVIPQSFGTLGGLATVLDCLADLMKGNTSVVLDVKSNLKEAASVLEAREFLRIFEVEGSENSVALYKRHQIGHTNGTSDKRDFVIIEPSTSSSGIQSFSGVLREALSDQGYGVSATTWGEISTRAANEIDGKTFISLLELEQAMLYNLSESDFHSIRKLVLNCERLLWINCGDDPSMAVIDGLARTMRSELASIKFQVLHLSGWETALQHGPSLAARIVTSDTADSEFQERGGLLQISRIFNSFEGNERVRDCLEDTVRTKSLTHQDGLRLTIGKPGLLDTLTFINDDRMEVPLGETEVEVEVKATGVK